MASFWLSSPSSRMNKGTSAKWSSIDRSGAGSGPAAATCGADMLTGMGTE